MSLNRRVIEASQKDVFDVLADPRGYAYWVIGAAEIRRADDSWPAQGSRFHHTVRVGPITIKDHTVVEEVRPPEYLQIEAKTRPFGKARVKLALEAVDGSTEVTMIEDPADRRTAFLFTPVTHLLMRKRNVRSLDRLAELAEGRRPIPGEEPEADVRTVEGAGAVVNPQARARHERGMSLLRAMTKGAFAGLCGASAMSASTNVEMRLRGRAPSYAPANAVGRVLRIPTRSKGQKMVLSAVGHVGLSASLGTMRGVLDRLGMGSKAAALTLFGAAMIPEIVVVPALKATDPPWEWTGADATVSVLHHGVFAAVAAIVYDRLAPDDDRVDHD